MTSVKASDVLVGECGEPLVYVARSLIKDPNAAKYAALVLEALPHFKKLLTYSDKIKVRVAKIKGRFTGRCSSEGNVIEIDPTNSFRKFLEVLAHELVHAEQFHTGRLKQEWNPQLGKWVSFWRGTAQSNRGTTYAAYRKQPWEAEAFSRQAYLADLVYKELKKNYAE